MAKYKVKDINKNGKIDSWEQAKYDAINKSAESPATMTGMPIAPIRPVNNVFSPQTQQVANQIYGEQVPGSYDRVLPQGMYATPQEAITAKTNSRMAQALGGALSPFSQSTYGMLGAKTSKQAAEAERKRKEAQKKAKEEKEKKDKKNNKK